MTRGLPASGKTTWAKEQVLKSNGRTKRVNKDDLRAMLDAGKWSKHNESFILRIRDAIVFEALLHGYDVIVDDTNLDPKHEAQLRAIRPHKTIFEIKDFTDVTPEECIKRDQNRPNYVGEKVIWSMYNTFLKKKGDVAQYTPPPYDPDLPDCIIVDIDGTLAHMTGRSPYDYSKVHTDAVDAKIREIVQRYYRRDINEETASTFVVVLSGRTDDCKIETESWLKANNIPYDLIYMRAAGDNRKDSIVKNELYQANIKGKFNVRFVLDDRQQVVDMWRKIGLKCLQVEQGNF
jgi:predicted kinase